MNSQLLSHLAEVVRLRIWIAPAISAMVATLCALLLVELDRRGLDPAPIEIDPVSARAALSAITTAMISFTALVFSVTMLVLQLASTQLSPRVMRTFLRDRTNQAVLSLFVATFVFALLVLVSITPEQVPQLAILITIVLVLAAVLAFVAYIDHMAHTIRASSVIEAIAVETRATIEQTYPEDAEADPDLPDLGDDRATVACRQAAGYVVLIDVEALADAADVVDGRIELLPRYGDFVATGAPLAKVQADAPGRALSTTVDEAVRLDSERAMTQDARFGLRQLLDVALRALSPGTNDQTTANDVIDRIGDLLRLLGSRPMPSRRVTRRDGHVRVIVPGVTWPELVDWIAGELADAARELPFVRTHLSEVLAAAAKDVPAERRGALEAHAAKLRSPADQPGSGPASVASASQS